MQKNKFILIVYFAILHNTVWPENETLNNLRTEKISSTELEEKFGVSSYSNHPILIGIPLSDIKKMEYLAGILKDEFEKKTGIEKKYFPCFVATSGITLFTIFGGILYFSAETITKVPGQP